MFVIKNSYLAAINFITAPGNGQKLFFNDIPVLRDKKITAVEVLTAGDLAVDPSLKTVIADADAEQVTITMVNKRNQEFVYNTPVLNFSPRNQNGIIRTISPTILDLQRSYILITDNTGISAGESICFNFYYEN